VFSFPFGLSTFYEKQAASNPNDANAQAAYYQRLLDEDPYEVIKRYESGKYAANEECTMAYISALQETGEIKKLTSVIHCKKFYH
jgi:hypothetical protein